MTSTNSTNSNKQYRKVLGIAGAFLTLAVPYFIKIQNVHGHIESEQSFCPFMMLTGLPCPGCGITKSFIFLYDGNLVKSFYYHLFGPLAFVACIAAIVTLTAELITNKEYFTKFKYNKKLAYGMGISLGVYHFARLVYFLSTHNAQDVWHQSIWG